MGRSSVMTAAIVPWRWTVANLVRVLVMADTKKALQEIDNFSGSVGGGLSSAAKIGAAAVAGIGAAGAAGLAVSVNAAANFEHALDQVGAVANATEEEMKGLSDTALRIGRDTAFSATEAAGAMEMLAANGVSVADIMNGAADAAVALAAAGGTDLAMAADVSSTSMAIWGLKGSEMTDVVNRLAGAANVSRFGIEDMAGAIAMGGGAAKLSGMEFEDFSAAIAAIAPNFSSGSDAGTSFKQFMAGLTPETNHAKDAFLALGLTAEDGSNRFFDAAGNLKSMAEITGILNEATRDLSEEQKSTALTTIFGSDAMRAAAGVAGLTQEEFEALQKTMGDTNAADVAAQRMGNFKGSMEAFKGSLETVQIEIGMKFLPLLTRLADFAAKALPVAFAYFETEIEPKIKAFAISAAAAIRGFVDVAGPYIERFASEAQRQFARFQGYYQSDLKPVFDNIVTSVEYVIQKFRENWDKIGPIVETFAKSVKNSFEIIGNALQIVIDLLGGDFSGAWENTKQLLKGIMNAWKLEIQLVVAEIKLIFAVLKDIGSNAMEGLKDGAAAIWETLVWPFFKSIPGLILEAFGDVWSWMSDIGINLVNGLFSGIKSTFDSGIGAITNKLDPRNWDIPGLSPLPQAMEHAGNIGGSKFVYGIAAAIAADGPSAFSDAMASAVKSLYDNVPDYVKKFSPAAGGSKSAAGPYNPLIPTYIGGGTMGFAPSNPGAVPLGSYYPGLGYKTANGWEQTLGAAADIDAAYASGAYGNAASMGKGYSGGAMGGGWSGDYNGASQIVVQLVVDGKVLADVVTKELARAM